MQMIMVERTIFTLSTIIRNKNTLLLFTNYVSSLKENIVKNIAMFAQAPLVSTTVYVLMLEAALLNAHAQRDSQEKHAKLMLMNVTQTHAKMAAFAKI